MNLLILVWSYLKARPLNTALNVLLLGLGTAMIVVLILFNNQLDRKIEDNVRGIDLVVGAKGSPMQIILCNIFHIDFPTGNINLAEAEKISRGRLIEKAIPLALGDSYKSFRIVGTNKDYPELYKATLVQGDWWNKPMETTIGSVVAEKLKLKVGDSFTSSHGLTSDLDKHDDEQFVVKGILIRTNTVVDNLILTGVESIWEVHAVHDDTLVQKNDVSQDTAAQYSHLVHSVLMGDSTKEITSLLILYRSPMAAIQLPRLINSQTSMQAASPAFETARLFSMLGIGVEVIMAFAYVLIAISGLSIFIALYNSLKERRYDMAIMRSMGASRLRLFMSILVEGSVLTVMGSGVGILLGHGILILLSGMDEMMKAGINGFIFYNEEWIILLGSLLLGLVSAFIPGIQAYRTDISSVLAGEG